MNIGYALWHAKHELFHIVLGLLWVWFLGAYSLILVAVIGSLLPDIDHLIYFFTYGKKDPYTRAVFSFVKKREWSSLISFIETGHKHNTNLAFHNIYIVFALVCSAYLSYAYQYAFATVLLGAMASHFLFDIAEDFVLLGSLNTNWTRFGRPKKYLRA